MRAVDGILLTVLVENYVDMLLPDTDRVKRAGLIHHFDPKFGPVRAENGIAFLAEIYVGDYVYRVLFDSGFTADVILHNMRSLRVTASQIDHVVVSHGHPDHCGDLPGVLREIGHPVPVSVHPDAFWPRYLRLASGEVSPFYNFNINQHAWEQAGARLVLNEGPAEVGPGTMATGYIDRAVPFEPPRPAVDTGGGLFHLKQGHFQPDVVPDDQALAINVKGKGLIILTGCAHAGIVNSIQAAQEATGVKQIYGVFGGFHLGFPGVPEENTHQTIEALRRLEPQILSPMHCTGFKAIAAISREMPRVFLLQTAGTRIKL
ncbi:MAG: MBL fold metallo-hydrolase [Ardenticatenaceae bacterium]|nr:MBL fold metallo-hydrolase [Ardenticatenaceae bacterium]